MDWLTVFQNSLTQMIGVSAIIYCLAALGLNIQFGYTGLLNFGQAGFAAIGAYAIAVTVATLGWPLWIALFFGILGAIIFALLLGIPTLRLRADYLAIVTIAAAEIIRQVARSVSLASAVTISGWSSTDGPSSPSSFSLLGCSCGRHGDGC